MTAKPDISDQNVRITHVKPKKAPPGAVNPRTKKVSNYTSDVSVPGSDDTSEKNGAGFQFENVEEPALGRSTIKNISKLIVERDVARVKSANTNNAAESRKAQR